MDYVAELDRLEAERANRGEPSVPFDMMLGQRLDELIAAKRQPVDAVPTPLPAWNRVCRDEGGGKGLARGWHVIVAANTGTGKSLLGLNLAAHAIRHGEHVAFVSLEMSQPQVATRLMAIHSGLAVARLEHGDKFSPEDAKSAATYLREVYERTGGAVFVNRRPISKLEDVVAAVRYEHDEHACRFVVIDYLQLAWIGSAGSLFESIQTVSNAVRQLAADLDIVSVGLSQFNRETSANRRASPTVQGLMGGSVLENDCDQVLLFDHTKHERQVNSATTELEVAKNRHGPQVRIPVRWDYRNLRISEQAEGDVGR